MEVITILAMGFVCAACFLLGAKVGQTVAKGEPVEVPNINPVKAVEEHRAKKEAKQEKNKYDTILRNIDNYDGTPYGQEDVPGR